MNPAQTRSDTAAVDRRLNQAILIRTKLQQVASRRWTDGRVSHERFYYKGSL